MSSVAIVPAAGKGARFGGAKLLADVGGEPLLNRTIRSLLEGGVKHVVVVLAEGASIQVPAFADRHVHTTTNPDPSRGMLSSIQAGLTGAVGDQFLILPGDMPFVRSDTVKAVLDAARETDAIVSPRYRNKRGHPVSVPGRLRAELLSASSTSSLKDVLATVNEQKIEIDVDDPGVLRDVDERQDLSL
jgi:molybdenum cofactor cytidylyltransferase